MLLPSMYAVVFEYANTPVAHTNTLAATYLHLFASLVLFPPEVQSEVCVCVCACCRCLQQVGGRAETGKEAAGEAI